MKPGHLPISPLGAKRRGFPHSENPDHQDLGGHLQLVDLEKDLSRGNERLKESDI
jgi:hypothetical protein